jgi:hypothetical protein
MVLKIFKALWFLSALALLVSLLFVYASLPQDVVIQEKSTGKVIANRDFLFYAITALLLLVNVLVYFVGKLYRKPQYDDFRSWFHGLIITINVFLVFAMNLIQTYNSAEKFDYSRVGFMIYGSVGLVVIWAAVWPLYALYKKIFAKELVL